MMVVEEKEGWRLRLLAVRWGVLQFPVSPFGVPVFIHVCHLFVPIHVRGNGTAQTK
jgi:hypothetical protein